MTMTTTTHTPQAMHADQACVFPQNHSTPRMGCPVRNCRRKPRRVCSATRLITYRGFHKSSLQRFAFQAFLPDGRAPFFAPKKSKASVKGMTRRSVVTGPQQDRAKVVQHQLSKDPSLWRDNRKHREATPGQAAYVTETDCPSVLSHSLATCLIPGVLSSSDPIHMEHLWQEPFKDPLQSSQDMSKNQNYECPDFMHKTTNQSFWIDDEKTPEWVKNTLEKRTPQMITGGSFESSSCSCDTSRADVEAHRRLPGLNEVKDIHAHMIESGNRFQLFKTNALMDMYVKCGSMVDAQHVFDSMLKHDVVSWNMIILGYAKQAEGALALELYSRMHQEGVQPRARTFVAIVKACSGLAAMNEGLQDDGKVLKMRCLEKGRAIHSQVLKTGFELDIFVANTLVDMYAKCASMEDARHVFDKMPHHDVVSWTTMIFGYANQEEFVLALELSALMHQEGVHPNARTFVCTLKACIGLTVVEVGTQVDGKLMKIGCLEKARAIHSQVLKTGLESNGFVGNTLMDIYVKCGSMDDALHVFDGLPHRDVVSWTAMMSGYGKQEQGALTLSLYERMHRECVQTSARTFVCALKACSMLATREEGKRVDGNSVKIVCLEKGRAIHSQVVKCGFELDIFVGNILVDTYAKAGSMDDAHHVFSELPDRDVVTWTSMISGYVKQEEGMKALDLYAGMNHEDVHPSVRTFVCVLKACSSLAELEEGMKANLKIGCLEKGRYIHSQVVKTSFESDVFVGTALVDMYAKCGNIEDAHYAFNKLPYHDVVSWTAMILGYANEEKGAVALELYLQMHKEGIQPNDRTFVCVLKACSTLSVLEAGKGVDGTIIKLVSLEKGRAIHSQVVESRFESDVFVGTTLVDMYAKCGSMGDARHAFDGLPRRDVVCWNVMIAGYADKAESEESLKLYAQMQEQGLSPNSLTFVSVLKACGNIAALETGKKLHAQVRRAGLETTTPVATTLIDMYAKCGSMVDAQQLFDTLSTRDVVTWSVLLAGYAHQGESKIVFDLFERMRQEGIKPDGVAALSVLTVCNHAGLVNMGRKYFKAMSTEYGIIPTIEHYNCMVDLLGRMGELEEAVTMLKSMPLEPDVVVWLTILGACRKWNNVEVGRHAFEQAVRLDRRRSAAYVLMSNIYAHAHMWEERHAIQVMRKNAQAWKKPGQSWWMDVDGTVHTFAVGDTKHPQSKYIYAKLKSLSLKMKEEGYVPVLDCVLQEICDDEKEDALCGHSEKLAIACALINTPEGTPILIVKNLRVCDDCHKAIALISKIEERNIVCRDTSRFHNYRDGKCSCGDYW